MRRKATLRILEEGDEWLIVRVVTDENNEATTESVALCSSEQEAEKIVTEIQSGARPLVTTTMIHRTSGASGESGATAEGGESPRLAEMKQFVTDWETSETIGEFCARTGMDRRDASNEAASFRRRGIGLKQMPRVQQKAVKRLTSAEFLSLAAHLVKVQMARLRRNAGATHGNIPDKACAG